MKEITGGDLLDCRGLYQTNKTIETLINIFVACNNLPEFKFEYSILKRLIIVPFNNTFSNSESKKTEILRLKDQLFSFIMKYGRQDSFFLIHTKSIRICVEWHII